MNKYLLRYCMVLAPTAIYGMVKMPDITTFNQQVEVVASVCYENKDLSDHQRYCAGVVVNKLHVYKKSLANRLLLKDQLNNNDKEYLRDRIADEYDGNLDKIIEQVKSDKEFFAREKREQDASSFRSKIVWSSLASIVVYALFLI